MSKKRAGPADGRAAKPITAAEIRRIARDKFGYDELRSGRKRRSGWCSRGTTRSR